MSQTKAQLVGGVGISTVGDLSVYGGVNDKHWCYYCDDTLAIQLQ
jgi:hypothetical protein